MIQHWDLVGNWYIIAQYVCYSFIGAMVIVVVKDFINKKTK